MAAAKWTWHFRKGLGWAAPIGIGAMWGFKNLIVNSIAYQNNYVPVIFPVIAAGLALWLGGLRRVNAEVGAQADELRRRVEALDKSGPSTGPGA